MLLNCLILDVFIFFFHNMNFILPPAVKPSTPIKMTMFSTCQYFVCCFCLWLNTREWKNLLLRTKMTPFSTVPFGLFCDFWRHEFKVFFIILLAIFSVLRVFVSTLVCRFFSVAMVLQVCCHYSACRVCLCVLVLLRIVQTWKSSIHLPT